MATIKIENLNPVGSAFFNDSESYLTDLTEEQMSLTHGGFIVLTFLVYAYGRSKRWW